MKSEKYTAEVVSGVIKKLKRRSGIKDCMNKAKKDGEDPNRCITIKMIARELECSRQTLYKEGLRKVLLPYGYSTEASPKGEPKKGSLEYFKGLVEKRDAKVEELDLDLKKAMDRVVDYEVLLLRIEKLEKSNRKLVAVADNAADRKEEQRQEKMYGELAEENRRLREQLLRAGMLNK